MINDVKGKYDEFRIVKVLVRLWVNAYLSLNRNDLGVCVRNEVVEYGFF
jgi:hypothetical protein